MGLILKKLLPLFIVEIISGKSWSNKVKANPAWLLSTLIAFAPINSSSHHSDKGASSAFSECCYSLPYTPV